MLSTKAAVAYTVGVIVLFLALVFGLFFLTNALRTQKFRDSDPILFSDCVSFPDGWQPIAGEVHNNIYLCQNTVTTEYRKCIPQYVTCEGE